MFEMRWVALGNLGRRFLQYRFIQPCVDASGALCPGDKFTEWRDVPTIDVNEAAWEDVVASGGIANAP